MIQRFLQKLRRPDSTEGIVVVSGLPRSGTSMMMKMLEAGGIPILTDRLREADDDNPEGYYEFERVKKLDKGDTEWVGEAHGRVVKVISALLKHLPAGHHYKVLFMKRQMQEILASQKRMLENRGEPTDAVDDEKMAQLFETHLEEMEGWLRQQQAFDVLYVDYNQMLIDSGPEIDRVNRFLGGKLEVEAMRCAVDPKLYRQRSDSNCLTPGSQSPQRASTEPIHQ